MAALEGAHGGAEVLGLRVQRVELRGLGHEPRRREGAEDRLLSQLLLAPAHGDGWRGGAGRVGVVHAQDAPCVVPSSGVAPPMEGSGLGVGVAGVGVATKGLPPSSASAAKGLFSSSHAASAPGCSSSIADSGSSSASTRLRDDGRKAAAARASD